MYKYWNPDERRGGILSRRSTKCEDGNAQASICSIAFPSPGSRPSVFAKATPRRVAVTGCHPTIRWGSVCFFAIPTGFVRVAHSTPWLFYAASPYGEAHKFRSPVGSPDKFQFEELMLFCGLIMPMRIDLYVRPLPCNRAAVF